MKSKFIFLMYQLLAIAATTAGFAAKWTKTKPWPPKQNYPLANQPIRRIKLSADFKDGGDAPGPFHVLIHPALLTTAAAALIFTSPMRSNAQTSVSNADHISTYHSNSKQVIATVQNYWGQHSSPAITTTTDIDFATIQLANSLAGPIGDLEKGSNTGIDPTFSTFGQWFFLLYVGVSLLAGGKEVLRRIQKLMEKDS